MTLARSFRAKSRNAGTGSSRLFLDVARDERVWGAALAWCTLSAAAPQTAIDAERAFAADAQTRGQWTAFRKWAAPDALLFVPQPVNAHEFLKNVSDPQVTFQWWPAQAFVSCDGATAVTTGPAVRGAYRGYFTTIWQRQPDGAWKWVLDHGAPLTKPRPAGDRPRITRPACSGAVPPIVRGDAPSDDRSGHGQSADGRLQWGWFVGPTGSRSMSVHLWTGRYWRRVLVDDVTAS